VQSGRRRQTGGQGSRIRSFFSWSELVWWQDKDTELVLPGNGPPGSFAACRSDRPGREAYLIPAPPVFKDDFWSALIATGMPVYALAHPFASLMSCVSNLRYRRRRFIPFAKNLRALALKKSRPM
jgi:hypothetical protein